MQKINKFNISLILAILLLISNSCKKFVDVESPIDQVISNEVFKNNASAIASVTGIYSEMMNSNSQFSSGFTTLFAGMAADELYYYSPSFRDEFVKNQITQTNHSNLNAYFWQPIYKYIYSANLTIEQLSNSVLVTPPVKSQLIGECKFVRAFCYFYLINLFGDAPLANMSDYRINQSTPRSSMSSIYAQIVSDLKDSENDLPSIYPTSDKARPNKFAAAALLSRIYLYNKDWVNAEAKASSVINGGYNLVTDLNKVFLKSNNAETIWQLQPVRTPTNTFEGNYILPASSSETPKYLITNSLINAFEANDQRKIAWVASRLFASQTLYYPYKYKIYGNNAPLTESYVVLRLAEQYLIRSEARAKQNNVQGSQADLNIIRNRAGLPNTIAIDAATLTIAIEQERRIELFAEWGHRWFDLKRNDRATSILSVLKPITWQSTDVLWPIPQSQINLNPALTQNIGY